MAFPFQGLKNGSSGGSMFYCLTLMSCSVFYCLTLMSCSWTLAASAGLKCLARTVDSVCHTPPCGLLLPLLPAIPAVEVRSPTGRTTRFSLASGPMA